MEKTIPTLVEYSIKQTDVSETSHQYVVSFANGIFLKVSEKAKLIIDEVNGMRSFSEISDILQKKYQINFSPEEIEDFIVTELGSQGLVKGIEAQGKNIKSRLWLHFPLLNGNLFERLARMLVFLFKWPFVLTILLAGLMVSIPVWDDFTGFTIQTNLSWLNMFVILLLYLICIIGHEMGHIAASYFWNVKPGKIGIGVYLFMPVIYVDLSQAWLLNKWQRAFIGASGFYFQIVLLVFLFPAAFLNTYLFTLDNYHILVQLNLLTILFNSNPLMRGDGYWILSDLLGIVNLHQRTNNQLVNFRRKIFRSPNYDPNINCQLKSSAKMIFYIWSFGYIGMILFILARVGIKALDYVTSGQKLSWEMIMLLTIVAIYILIPIIRNIKIKNNRP